MVQTSVRPARPVPAQWRPQVGARQPGTSPAHLAPEPPHRRFRPHGPRTVPGRIRMLTGLVLVATVAVWLLAAGGFGSARGGLSTLGGKAGPEVVATADLSFALSDMDAALANTLLTSHRAVAGATAAQARKLYEQRRREADQDLLAAGEIADGNHAADHALTEVTNDLGSYEALAAETVLLDRQSAGPHGTTGPAALQTFRQATDLMSTRLLPAADTLITDSTNLMNTGYRDATRGTGSYGGWLVTLGVLLVGLLLALQLYVGVKFRRVFNLTLMVATLLAGVLAFGSSAALGGESEHLRRAQHDAFDSVLALSQARALAYDANADESRYLVDPDRAGQYEGAFLDKSRRLLAVGNDNDLAGYQSSMNDVVQDYDRAASFHGFTGLLGTEFDNITFPGERERAERALTTYRAYQLDDEYIRNQVGEGNRDIAIAFCITTAPGASNAHFAAFDRALRDVRQLNLDQFHRALDAGRGLAGIWSGIPPFGAVLVVGGLLVLGVRPRLAEYR